MNKNNCTKRGRPQRHAIKPKRLPTINHNETSWAVIISAIKEIPSSKAQKSKSELKGNTPLKDVHYQRKTKPAKH